jgi:hypothetical protein
MPSEKQQAAELALEQNSELLTNLGAHSFSVGSVRHKGKKEIGIVVNFENQPPKALPEEVSVTRAGKKHKVPIKGKGNVARFQAE